MLTRRLLPALLLALVLPAAPGAQRAAVPGAAPPAAQGPFAADRLARIDALFNRYVDESRIAGAVVLVLRDGRPVYERAFGWSDKDAGRKMTTDSIFRIASQSKALTSAGIRSLMEEGRLSVNDRVSLFIPAFAKTTVTMEANGAVFAVPAKRQITIHDLLTHTAGISYGTGRNEAALYEAKGLGPAAGFGWYTADKDEPVCDTMERLASLPFTAQPGESYVYGYNTDILGCVIERASGMPLDKFIDPYFQEVYLEAESLPLFNRLVSQLSSDAVDTYVDDLEYEVHKYVTRDRNFGKAARRMYNVFRLTGRYAEAAYLRELFDEPTTVLYQIAALIRTLDEADRPGAAFDHETLISQTDSLIISAVAALEGKAETDMVRALLSVRDNLARASGGEGRSVEVEQVRSGAIAAVNDYFERRLLGMPQIKAYLDDLAARQAAASH